MTTFREMPSRFNGWGATMQHVEARIVEDPHWHRPDKPTWVDLMIWIALVIMVGLLAILLIIGSQWDSPASVGEAVGTGGIESLKGFLR